QGSGEGEGGGGGGGRGRAQGDRVVGRAVDGQQAGGALRLHPGARGIRRRGDAGRVSEKRRRHARLSAVMRGPETRPRREIDQNDTPSRRPACQTRLHFFLVPPCTRTKRLGIGI